MEFHFVTIKSGGSATLVDGHSKPRFVCFKDPSTTRVYIRYLCEHKAKFGTWPAIDLSSQITKVRILEDHKEQIPELYEDLLEIKYKTIDDLDNMSIMTGISYFYCHRFQYEDLFSLSISGQEVDGDVDDFLYREHLNYSLKNN